MRGFARRIGTGVVQEKQLKSLILAQPERWRSQDQTLQLFFLRSEEHTSELQSHSDLVCRLLLEKKKKKKITRKNMTVFLSRPGHWALGSATTWTPIGMRDALTSTESMQKKFVDFAILADSAWPL